jgi:hypothetical protein
VPDELGPAASEAAVLSLLVVREGTLWAVVSGSLLTVPLEVALMSWKRWGERQPHARPALPHEGLLDLGPIFCVEPFAGIRAVRAIVAPDEWRTVVEGLAVGAIDVSSGPCTIEIAASTSTVLLGHEGVGPAYDAVGGARRPVLGVALALAEREIPETDPVWELVAPSDLPPGPELAERWANRNLLNWPLALLGIRHWPAGGESKPPATFVIGRTESRAWIAQVKPDLENEALIVQIAWDEDEIDPLGCSVLIRAESDGLPVLVREQRLSNLPDVSSPAPTRDPRKGSWRERTLDVRLPRGGRRTTWGLQLFSANGTLLDERPVAARFEQIKMSMHVGNSRDPTSMFEIGDTKPPPTQSERDAAIRATAKIDADARRAAAARRISTAGELERYLGWRFSCREGELLLLDPGLFSQSGREADVVRFLAGFDRPIRTLVRGRHEASRDALADARTIVARALPGGGRDLHDRIWIVGDTAVLVGASPGDFLTHPENATTRATTASDLPFGDAVLWRERFEEWWAAAH